MNRSALLLCLLGIATACDDAEKKDAIPSASAAPAATGVPATSAITTAATATGATAASATAAAEDAPSAGTTRFVVLMGKGTFVIDAPLEKIKGISDEVRGHVDVNPKDLTTSRGVLMVRMSTLKTSTFGDMGKDAAQTDHARNWMEVGNDSPASARMKYEWASFTIASLEATPAALADAKDDNGARTIKARVVGDLTLHGVTSHKTVPLTITFKGTADAPTEISLKTDEAFPISMKEHAVMPRDKVGGFLNGALERIGKKIDDKVAVSFEANLKATMPPQP
jgi:polyisoprenoid-binding protein YceI